jgi:2'-5' RNA ligase
MDRFNIALLPEDASLQDRFADVARSSFAGSADGYILGVGALAHVTLSQFRAPTERIARAAFASWENTRPLRLLVGEFRLRAGENEHAGTWWAYFRIERSPDLLRQQSDCASRLGALGLEVLTATDAYAPHITLARLSKPDERSSPQAPCEGPIEFIPRVGRSTENGVFLRPLD